LNPIPGEDERILRFVRSFGPVGGLGTTSSFSLNGQNVHIGRMSIHGANTCVKHYTGPGKTMIFVFVTEFYTAFPRFA
jgi:hypothetical protein